MGIQSLSGIMLTFLFVILICSSGVLSLTHSKGIDEKPDTLARSTCFSEGVEYHGGGLENPMLSDVRSAGECQTLCQGRDGCNFFTWVNSEHEVASYRDTCWLKGTQGTPQSCSHCV